MGLSEGKRTIRTKRKRKQSFRQPEKLHQQSTMKQRANPPASSPTPIPAFNRSLPQYNAVFQYKMVG